jgi:anti-anti-sigma factor
MSRASFQLHNMAEPAGSGRPVEVAVSGEVDVTNADNFGQSVTELTGAAPVILELSRLHYLDSAGFAALDRLLKLGVVFVVSEQSPIRRAAELMQLPFHRDVEAARRAC